jgi:hypothetical protein
MTGPIEAGATVAQSAIDALRSAPVLIALVMLQGFTLAGIAWSIHERAQYMAEERKLFAEDRKTMLEVFVKKDDLTGLLPLRLGDK